MKNHLLTVLLFVIASTFALSQEKAVVSRIKISASITDLEKIRKAGIDFDHGFYDFKKYSYTNEFNATDVDKIRQMGFRVEVLVKDVFAYNDSLNRIEDPYKYERYPVNVDPKYNNLRLNFISNCQSYDTYITSPTSFTLGSRGGFYTLAELEAQIDDMVADRPDLVSKSTIGNTLQGRPIWVVKISDNVSADETEPEVLYSGLHHAREGMGMMGLIYYMRYLIENYDNNPKIKDLVNSRELFFIPVANIDGFNYNTTSANWTAGRRMRRKNMYNVPVGYNPNAAITGAAADGSGGPGVDINRNYGTYWGSSYSNSNVGSSGTASADAYRGTAAFSEPETQRIRDFVNGRSFKLALNYHCYSNLWIRPQGPDLAIYPATALAAADVNIYNSLGALFTKYNCYLYGTPKQVLYEVNGYSDDWFFSDPSHSPVYSFSPEVGTATDGFWCAQARIIPLAKEMLFANLQAAYSAGSYAEVNDNSDINISSSSGSFNYIVTRRGLTNAGINLSLIPLANIQTAGSPVTNINIGTFGGTFSGSINYTLTPSLPAGSFVRYIWRMETGGITVDDTITKIYNQTPLFADNMDNAASFATNWVRSGTGAAWAYSSGNGVGATSSLTESPSGNYANSADHIVRMANAVSLASATKAYLSFMVKYASESCEDRMQVEISTTGPTGTYSPICTNTTVRENRGSLGGVPALTGNSDGWIREIIDLNSYLGNANVAFRFRFRSDGSNAVAYSTSGFDIDNFSIIKTSSSLLPVKFEDITAVKNGDDVLIRWKAQTDAYFSYYEIQRSADGVNFNTIATTSDATATSAIDGDPLRGNNYYRIKAYDKDGSFQISKVVLVVFESGSQISAYPNPVVNVLNIEMPGEKASKVFAEISTVSGQTIYRKDFFLKPGYNQQQVNMSSFTAQMYVVRIKDDSGNVLKTFKVVKN